MGLAANVPKLTNKLIQISATPISVGIVRPTLNISFSQYITTNEYIGENIAIIIDKVVPNIVYSKDLLMRLTVMVKHNESKGRAATNIDVMKMKSSMTVLFLIVLFGNALLQRNFLIYK